MDFFDVINERCSVRSYKDRPVEMKMINRILETINLAPSAGNRQAYEVYLMTDADKKSYAVWLLPLLAVALAAASWLFGKNKWVNLVISDICILVFAIGVFKISTTDLDKAVLKVTIQPGIWIILWSYLLMGAVGLFDFISQTVKAKKG